MDPAQLRQLYLQALQAGDQRLASLYLSRLQAAQRPETVEVEREGLRFRAPAGATEEQIQEFVRLRTAEPLQRAAPPPPEPLPPRFTVEARRQQAAQEAARADVGARAPFIPAGEQEAQQAAAEQRFLEVQQPGQLTAGAREPVRTAPDLLPPFRPTNIRRLAVYRRVPEEQRAGMTPEQIALEETRPPAVGEDATPLAVERFYVDPETRRPRPPSRTETFVESFAQQPVLSEAAARRQAEMQTEELQSALRGERLPPLSASLSGLVLSALTEQREEGRGITETPLQATLRGLTGAGSALAAETIGTLIPEEQTQRAVEEGTALDPEMRRRASTDPDFVDRVLENITTGRGVGDEYYDIDVFRQTAGDVGAALLGEEYREQAETAPFFVGTLIDMASPGYLGLAKAGAGAAAKLPGAGQALSAAGQPFQAAIRKRVSTRIIDQTTLEPAQKQLARDAIRGSDGTEAGITRAVEEAVGEQLGPDTGAAFREELQLRTPADFEMVTETIAVPRADAPQVRQAVQQEVRAQLARPAQEQASLLEDLVSVASDTGEGARQRTAAVADRIAAGADVERLRAAPLQQARPETLAALQRSAEAIRGGRGAKATRAAEQALARLEADAQLPPGFLSQRLRQKLPREATLPGDVAGAVRDAPSWQALDARLREQAVEALRSRAAVEAAKGSARTSRQVSALQTTIRANNPWVAALQDVNDSQMVRWVRAAVGERAPTVSVQRATDKIRGAAEGALRAAEQEIRDVARRTGSADAAFESYFDRNTRQLSGGQRWERVLSMLYGEDAGKTAMVRARQTLGDLDDVPVTVEALKAFDGELRRARLVSAVPLTTTPARRVLLKLGLDEGVRKRAIADGIDFDVGLTGAEGRVFGKEAQPLAPGAPRWVDLAGGADPELRVVTQPGGDGARLRTYDMAASRAERRLAEGAEELFPFLETVKGPERSSTLRMMQDAGTYLYDQGRNAVNAARYGYVVPNLPYQLGRLFTLPILSLINVGVESTLRALPRLPRAVVDDVGRQLGRRRMGAGLETADGLQYTPAQLEALAQEHGIGYAMLDTQRVGSLARDISRSAQEAAASAPGKALAAARAVLDPTVKSVHMRLAEALEMGYRRSVFEGALAAGRTPSEAADLARRSLFDYGAQPELVRQLGRYMATAQTQYGLLAALTIAAVRNPESLGALARGMRAKQNARDPYGLDGDAQLNRLGVVTVGDEPTRFYGPEHPLFMPVDRTLSAVRWANLLVSDIRQAAEQAQSAPEAAAQVGGSFIERGVQLGVATLADNLPVVLRLAELQAQGADAGGQTQEALGEEALFWQAAVAARAADPDGRSGIWEGFLRIAQPEVVKPPEGAAHPVLGDYWLQQPPEGQPHILYGRDDQGRPLYMAFKPSARGQANLALIRAATPDSLERAFGAGAALIDAPAGFRAPGESIEQGAVPMQVFPETPTGAAAAAAQLVGTPAGTGRPELGRRQQLEALRRQMEIPQ